MKDKKKTDSFKSMKVNQVRFLTYLGPMARFDHSLFRVDRYARDPWSCQDPRKQKTWLLLERSEEV